MNKKNLLSGGALLLFCFFSWVQSLKIKVAQGAGVSGISSRAMPQALIIAIAALSVLLIAREVIAAPAESRRIPSFSVEKALGACVTFFKDNYEVLISFGLLALFIILLKSLGFIAAATVFLMSEMFILTPIGKGKYVKMALLSIFCAFFIYFLFVRLLNVYLPAGLAGNLFIG